MVKNVDSVLDGDEVVENPGGFGQATEFREEAEELRVEEVVVVEVGFDDEGEDLVEFV